jgi:hypothetical protein
VISVGCIINYQVVFNYYYVRLVSQSDVDFIRIVTGLNYSKTTFRTGLVSSCFIKQSRSELSRSQVLNMGIYCQCRIKSVVVPRASQAQRAPPLPRCDRGNPGKLFRRRVQDLGPVGPCISPALLTVHSTCHKFARFCAQNRICSDSIGLRVGSYRIGWNRLGFWIGDASYETAGQTLLIQGRMSRVFSICCKLLAL